MTAPNAALAYQVIDHIDAHPEQWQQNVYIGPAECGTVACFAGLTCLLSGEEPDYDQGLRPDGTPYPTALLRSGTPVPDRAQQLLGASRRLTDATDDSDDERDLFLEWNTREELGEMVAEIFGPRPEPTS